MNPFRNASLLRCPEEDGEDRYLTIDAVYDTPEAGGQYLLYIAVSGSYAVYIGKKLAAFGQFRSTNDTMAYDVCDLTPFFSEGIHPIRIDLFIPGKDFAQRPSAPGFIFELFRDGGSIFASSENSPPHVHPGYQKGETELLNEVQGFSFRFLEPDKHARTRMKVTLEPVPENNIPFLIENPVKRFLFTEPAPSRFLFTGSFSDTEPGKPSERMNYSVLSLCRQHSDLCLPCRRGVSLTANDGDGICVLLDLGKETAGILSLDILLPGRTEILIGWGDSLQNGRIAVCTDNRCFCASYTGNAGRHSFTHPFFRVGLRYLEVHIYTKQAVLYHAGILETRYPIKRAVMFRCEDRFHNRIYDMCLRSLRLRMQPYCEPPVCQSIPLSPTSFRVEMLCGYLAFRCFAPAYSGLLRLAQSIGHDGLLTFACKNRPIPFYSASYLIQVYEYLSHSGDCNGTKALLPVLKEIAKAFISRINPACGLISRFPEKTYLNFYEAQAGLTGSEVPSGFRIAYDAPLNAIVSIGLHVLHDILLMLPEQNVKEAEYFEKIHRALNRAIESHFWDEYEGCYATFLTESRELTHYCEFTNALVLCSGAAQSERLASVIRKLTDPQSTLLPVTPENRIIKFDALLNRSDKCGKAVFSEIRKILDGSIRKKIYANNVQAEPNRPGKRLPCLGLPAEPVYCYLKYGLHMLPSMTGIGQCSAIETDFCDTPPRIF